MRSAEQLEQHESENFKDQIDNLENEINDPRYEIIYNELLKNSAIQRHSNKLIWSDGKEFGFIQKAFFRLPHHHENDIIVVSKTVTYEPTWENGERETKTSYRIEHTEKLRHLDTDPFCKDTSLLQQLENYAPLFQPVKEIKTSPTIGNQIPVGYLHEVPSS